MDIRASRSVTSQWGNEAPVSSLMRRHWIAAAPHATLLEAAHLMRLARVRHLPVAEGGVLLGLLDHGEVLRASLEEVQRSMPGTRLVSELMDRYPPLALPDESIQIAAARMLAASVACVPVIAEPTPAEPRLVGLVVESDLLRRVYGVEGSLAS